MLVMHDGRVQEFGPSTPCFACVASCWESCNPSEDATYCVRGSLGNPHHNPSSVLKSLVRAAGSGPDICSCRSIWQSCSQDTGPPAELFQNKSGHFRSMCDLTGTHACNQQYCFAMLHFCISSNFHACTPREIYLLQWCLTGRLHSSCICHHRRGIYLRLALLNAVLVQL